jgi:hypothetical protein
LPKVFLARAEDFSRIWREYRPNPSEFDPMYYSTYTVDQSQYLPARPSSPIILKYSPDMAIFVPIMYSLSPGWRISLKQFIFLSPVAGDLPSL